MPLLSIIGTAGRDGRMTAAVWQRVLLFLSAFIDSQAGLGITLVSGGAAWIDHLAVRLFLLGKVSKLVLHLPCPFDRMKQRFVDTQNGETISGQRSTGEYDWRINPGRTANYYHDKFSKQLGSNSLAEIELAIQKGATIYCYNGFHARNKEIAKTDLLLAFTWSTNDTPADGGTKHTWDCCQTTSLGPNKVHYSLTQF